MYTVHASQSDDATDEAPALHQFVTMDDAATHCFEMFRAGYTIHKVVLPSGIEIHQEELEHAFNTGINAVRYAISR
ncbi:MAG: hypothetical protein ABIS45_12320 [Burkholderiales bacterium]